MSKRPPEPVSVYVPASASLTTTDQRRLMRIGLTKTQATELLRSGVRSVPSVVGIRTVLKEIT